MATDLSCDIPAPECDHQHGLPAGVTDKGRELAIEARMRAQVADAEWLKRPFVPKDLDKFRSTRVVTNLGDLFPDNAEVWGDAP